MKIRQILCQQFWAFWDKLKILTCPNSYCIVRRGFELASAADPLDLPGRVQAAREAVLVRQAVQQTQLQVSQRLALSSM